MGIPDHLICLMRDLCAGQEATVRTRHGTTVWFQIRKGVCQGCILSPSLFNSYAEYIMRNTRFEAEAGIKIARGNINKFKHVDDTTLMTESEEDPKNPLMRVKEESEKAGLKLNIQKIKVMASGTITSWQIDGETVETVTDVIFLSSKVTADGDCSHEIKRHLLLGRKTMTNLDSILNKKQRHYFADKGLSSQSYGFSSSRVWMWVLDHKESWALKNWCFELWYWRRLLRVRWTARRSNQSTLKEISSEYIHWKDWCWSSNILAMWWEELTHWKRPWCWERLKVGREGDDRGWDGWMALTRWTWVWASSGSWWWVGKSGMLQSMGSQRVGHDWVTELNWYNKC